MSERVVALGTAALGLLDDGPGGTGEPDAVLVLGPQHPSSHGVVRLRLAVDGDPDDPDAVVTAADPVVSPLHRGVEKLFEVRDYRQCLVLADRHDWTGAFLGELGLALCVEQALGLAVPERATWVRTLLAEVQRSVSHLLFLGSQLAGPGALLPVPEAARGREALAQALEALTGSRVHPAYAVVGGLREDLPRGWRDLCRAAVATAREALDPLRRLLEGDGFRSAAAGVGVVPQAWVGPFGLTGAVARASGAPLDLRRDDPVLAYAELDVPLVTGTAGDAWERTACLLGSLCTALDLADACLDRLAALPRGPVAARVPTTVRPPEGETWSWTEAALGAQGWWLVSRGGTTPWRLHLRTPSLAHAALLPHLLPGTRVGDLPVLLASLFLVVGDLAK